jgi:hypothetical protein
MALGLSATLANAMLKGTGAGLDDYRWLQLHVGAPGAAFSANIAAQSTRFQVTWDTPVGGACDVTTDVALTGLAATETWIAFTAWSASTAGTAGLSGSISVGQVLSGANITIPTASITVTFTLAS